MIRFRDIFQKYGKTMGKNNEKKKGDCACGRKNQRMVKGKCNKCYQAEYGANRKKDREQYKF